MLYFASVFANHYSSEPWLKYVQISLSLGSNNLKLVELLSFSSDIQIVVGTAHGARRTKSTAHKTQIPAELDYVRINTNKFHKPQLI